MSEIIVTSTVETAESLEAGRAELAAEQATKITRDAARQVILDRLGITADEAKLLLS